MVSGQFTLPLELPAYSRYENRRESDADSKPRHVRRGMSLYDSNDKADDTPQNEVVDFVKALFVSTECHV